MTLGRAGWAVRRRAVCHLSAPAYGLIVQGTSPGGCWGLVEPRRRVVLAPKLGGFAAGLFAAAPSVGRAGRLTPDGHSCDDGR